MNDLITELVWNNREVVKLETLSHSKYLKFFQAFFQAVAVTHLFTFFNLFLHRNLSICLETLLHSTDPMVTLLHLMLQNAVPQSALVEINIPSGSDLLFKYFRYLII